MHQGGGGHQHQSQYTEMVSEPQSEQFVEAASPISSRPPATGNLDGFMRLASGVGGGDELGGDPAGGGGGAGVASGGNRWPRQETLALLNIRSDMDTTFRDASVKGPLWEDVSRKLSELGYKRSAKKCKEKFENVHKYYKRTKEGRGGRQDGKSYKFFSELEALHGTPSATANVSIVPVTPVTAAPISASLDVAPVSVGIPMPISSVRIPPTTTTPTPIPMSSSMLPMSGSAHAPVPVPVPVPPLAPPPEPITTAADPFGISFSSNSSSSSRGFEDDDDEDDNEDELGGGGEPSNMAGSSRKRKRQSSSTGGGHDGSTTKSMMEFFEGLMKQVMHKQEAMQQRFLKAIEKREQDRMIREEAWKRQEMARLSREHELMAQERAIAASRDAAIVSCLQKITGQTIQLPTTVSTAPAAATPPPLTQPTAVPIVPTPAPVPIVSPPLHQPPSLLQQQSHSQHQHQQQPQVVHQQHQQLQQHQAQNTEILMALPEQLIAPAQQEIDGSGSLEPASSSRWPKAEVLALINIRSGFESRYQEVGPKGPLWEEVSASMLGIGYKRSAKRCKEKWENINKYFKKVKESNKKRPEDAKTCPYFHQLDALYRKKILGSSGGSTSFSDRPELEEMSQPSDAPAPAPGPTTENKTDVPTSKEGNIDGAAKKPEGIVRELMEEQLHQGQSLLVDGYDHHHNHKINDEGDESDNMDINEEELDEDEDEELEQERKMGYKIEFQRQNNKSSTNLNGRGNGTPSFLAMVQ